MKENSKTQIYSKKYLRGY